MKFDKRLKDIEKAIPKVKGLFFLGYRSDGGAVSWDGKEPTEAQKADENNIWIILHGISADYMEHLKGQKILFNHKSLSSGPVEKAD